MTTTQKKFEIVEDDFEWNSRGGERWSEEVSAMMDGKTIFIPSDKSKPTQQLRFEAEKRNMKLQTMKSHRQIDGKDVPGFYMRYVKPDEEELDANGSPNNPH